MEKNKILRWNTVTPTETGYYWILMTNGTILMQYLENEEYQSNVRAYAGPLVPPDVKELDTRHLELDNFFGFGSAAYTDDDSRREEDEARTEHHEQGDR